MPSVHSEFVRLLGDQISVSVSGLAFPDLARHFAGAGEIKAVIFTLLEQSP